MFKVHRLVAQAFVCGEADGYVVNHIDGNPKNNNSVNLEWCTQSYNMKHACATGLRKHKYTKDEILLYYCDLGETQKEVAESLGINNVTVCNAMKKYGIEARRSKYHIDLQEMRKMFDDGVENKCIAIHFRCPASLVARRKYQYKRGEI